MDIGTNFSSLRPFVRPKEFYDTNDFFIARLPSNLRASGELEFHVGKGIFNRSDQFSQWAGNEALSRMHRKYCYVPLSPRDETCPSSSQDFAGSSSTGSLCSKLLPQSWPVSDSTALMNDMPNYVSPNLRNENHPNRSVELEQTNNLCASQTMAANSWSPFVHSSNTVLMQNGNDNIANTRKNRNKMFIGSQAGNEQFNEVFGHVSRYRKKKKPPSKEERPPKLQGSKLFSSLPVYQNEKSLISMLQSRNPKCVIFSSLNFHSRFLHNLPQILPPQVHLVIYFNHLYKFPLFVNAAMEQLLKTDCLHRHPDSNGSKAFSEDCLIFTINEAHIQLRPDVMFIILAGNNVRVNELIRRLVNDGRDTVVFKPSFYFSDFYSALKKCQSNNFSLQHT